MSRFVVLAAIVTAASMARAGDREADRVAALRLHTLSRMGQSARAAAPELICMFEGEDPLAGAKWSRQRTVAPHPQNGNCRLRGHPLY